MEPRFIFIHGNSTTHWSFGWAPWFKERLEQLGFSTFFETMPDSIIARSEYWLPFLKKHVKAGENDVLVGWSSGATATMRYTEENRVMGSILVSPSYTDLSDELEKQSGYFDKSWRWRNIKANQKKIALFYGDNDPYIPQEEFEFIANRLNPAIFKVSGGRHFEKRQDFPELLEYVKKTYSK